MSCVALQILDGRVLVGGPPRCDNGGFSIFILVFNVRPVFCVAFKILVRDVLVGGPPRCTKLGFRF